VAISFRSRTPRALRKILNDAQYRGSLTLLVNTVATSAIGFIFWTLAARAYPASTVGVFSGVTSGVGLLAAIAALGLPNTMIRYVVGAENQRQLVIMAIAAIATVGTTLCLITVLALGPHLPSSLHLQQRGGMILLVTVLVAVTAVSSTLDAGLVAKRSSHVVLFKNMVGSTVKVAALFLLASFQSLGLLIAYGLGLILSTLLSSMALGRRLNGDRAGSRSFLMLRSYLTFTSGNYLATVMGILPLTVVPIEVLVVLGATETARFAVAFLIVGFLNFIPSTMAQVLFAEASRNGAAIGIQLRKALRGVYGILLPALVITVAGAPLLLRLFGTAYATAATGCLRVLALSTLLTGGTYLVDSLLIARDRTAAYVFMNGANAALVLGCVGLLLPRGLTAAAVGWALGQGLSLVLGLIVLAAGRVGRHHHPRFSSEPARPGPQHSQHDQKPQSAVNAFEPRIQELLATWPMMPTTLIAELIGWDQSIGILLDRVTELRSAYSRPHPYMSRTRFQAGEIAQCGLWFPPIEIPVGFGQTRSGSQLPVLTMITGYSRWLSAILIPSGNAKDLFTGLWEILSTLGAVPHVLTWDSEAAIGRWEAGRMELTDECSEFCRALGVKFVVGRSADPETRGLIERAHAYLERSFLPNRIFASPTDFNTQLRDWLDAANIRNRQPPNRSPIELISADKQAMLPLPPEPPSTGWHLSMKVGSQPFLTFDSNAYSLHPAVIGRQVEVVADLSQVRVLCNGKVAADHHRAWARELIISDPDHAAALGTSSK
jgi:O-antigen/teichoic acid export membrane protein